MRIFGGNGSVGVRNVIFGAVLELVMIVLAFAGIAASEQTDV